MSLTMFQHNKMSASKKLRFHHEIHNHFYPCPALKTAETEGNQLLKEMDAMSSSDTIISNTSVWNNIEIFDDDKTFPTANLSSILDNDDIKIL
ncbi:hypothetical protein AgCh_012770 [Apium graveolens]